MKLITIVRSLLHFFRLDSELENPETIHEEIKKGIVFRGTNLWILIFAIVVASVGLNMNSTAVIIGAMLISPLMGPINGMGYSIATFDFELFKKSIKNFSFAILASLVASTIYFALSPVSTAHSELLARTSPTIYDVLIALFGGLAGIVAISSRQKGNVIPGVAIATALMPPLCTAGYGIATGQFSFFFGAFYLFTINTIFIALASVWVSQLLKFPIRNLVDDKQKKKINRIITCVILVVFLPSVFFGYNLVKKEHFTQKAGQFISNVSIFEGNYLLKHDVDNKEKKITLVYGGAALSEEQKENIKQKAKDFDLPEAFVVIQQGLSIGHLNEENVEILKLKEQIMMTNALLSDKNAEIDSIVNQQKFGKIILNEIKTIFPQINGCLYAESLSFRDSVETSQATSVVIFTVKSLLPDDDKLKLSQWIKQRMKNENVELYYELDKDEQ
ncbi:MAG: TIGR00341 family protein [Mangrovibacterium sp.]